MANSGNFEAFQGTIKGPHQGLPFLSAGSSLAEATTAMILVHGRGASAESILELAPLIGRADMVALAPQAAGGTWYPHSFLAPVQMNEPGLTSGLETVRNLVDMAEEAGIPAEKIVLAGFSQGACLASEFVARNARRYGALVVFSGGVIGPPGTPRNYPGDLSGMPVFIGCSDVDFHIPLGRVRETAQVFRQLGGIVTERIYPSLGHTINQDEIDLAREIVARIA